MPLATTTMSPPGASAMSSFCYEHCTYLPAMLGWFFFSAILSTYNKFVFGNGHMHFPCPLFLTSIHFSIQWLFAHVACACFPQSLGTDRIREMSWKEWASISIPCGMVTALDVGLSNLALVTITLTFYTMVKSSTPIFVLGWAYLLKIERITWPLIGVILVIASGEFLTVYGEVDFVLHGFLLCLAASILSGARWTLVQLKLQQLDPPLKSTLVTMKLLAPSMFWSMFIISMVVEQPWIKLKEQEESAEEMGKVFLLGLLGGVFAVVMILCEFYLILKASAIILMIGGVIKELTTIFIGVSFFKDKLNLINSTGVAIVFSGVLLYKVVFYYDKKAKQQQSMEEIPSDEPEEETEFLDEDLSLQQGLSADTPYKDHDSDNGLGNYHDEAQAPLRRSDPAVEMIQSNSDEGPLHLRNNLYQTNTPDSTESDSPPDNSVV